MRLPQLATTLALVVFACGGPAKPGSPTPEHPNKIVKADNPNGSDPLVMHKTAVDPKPLSTTVKKGLTWLAGHQLQNGGWGQGDEADAMRGSQTTGSANVADTSMALIAFLRAGHTPRGNTEFSNHVQKGIDYVLAEIEGNDDNTLYVSKVRGTRVQMKIGQYADTFAALMLLTEARGTGRDGVANSRIDMALKTVIKKVEKNQRENGSWDDQGWAPVLSQALAAKGLNRAASSGFSVDKKVLERVEAAAKSGQSARASAGVQLYGAAADSSTYRDTAVMKRSKVEGMKAAAKKYMPDGFQAPNVPTKAEIDKAEGEAKQAENAAVENERALVTRFKDSRFVAGFGNNGGEEYLSYLLISETLVQKGGDEWANWDGAIAKMVNGVQNEDGSWTGHHCITGRTFCTAAALLVLMGDRTPAVNVIAS
jgi:hypothetical protein